MSRVNFFSFFSNEFCHIHEWVLSHVRMSRVFFFLSNELRHRTNSVACTKETCHNKVTPRIRMSLVPCVNESCCTARELGDVSRAREHKSRDKCEWVMSHIWIESSQISKVWSRCRIHFRNATSHMWIYRFIYIRFIHMNQFMSRMWICHVTRVIDSCHTWIVCDDSCVIMPRHTREYAMSHMWIYHFIYTRFIYMNRVMSHMWTCHVTHVNISIHIHESTHVSHIHTWMGGVARMNELCLTYTHVNGWCHAYEWVMSHIYTREWVVSHIRMGHVARMNESRRTARELGDIARAHENCCVASIHEVCGTCLTWLIHMCDMTRDMTQSHAWHDLFVARTVCMRDMICDTAHSYIRHDWWCTCSPAKLRRYHPWGSWDMRDMTHLHVRHDSWHDSFTRATWLVTWLIHIRGMTGGMTNAFVRHHFWHDSFVRTTWLIHTCDMTRDMTHSHSWHERCNY